MKRLIRHVEGNPGAEGATGKQKEPLEEPMTDAGPIKVRSSRRRPLSERPSADSLTSHQLEP